jgi:hypothetical protein
MWQVTVYQVDLYVHHRCQRIYDVTVVTPSSTALSNWSLLQWWCATTCPLIDPNKIVSSLVRSELSGGQDDGIDVGEVWPIQWLHCAAPIHLP